MTVNECINHFEKQDPRYKERRFAEFKRAMKPFANELFRIYSIMPAGYRFDLQTKELTQVVEPKWQELIDRITTLRNECIKTNFPEFYEPL